MMQTSLLLAGTETNFVPVPCQPRRPVRRCFKAFPPVCPSSEHWPTESGLQDTWSDVEDVWSRMARLCPSKVIQADGRFVLAFAGFKDALWDGDLLRLRYRVLDLDLYRWNEQGSSGELVQLLEYRGRDLVIHMTSLARVKRCSEGDAIALQVAAFLPSLPSRSSCPTNKWGSYVN